MASPVNYGAGIKPALPNSGTTQTDLARRVYTLRIDPTPRFKGLGGAHSSIRSARSEQPSNAQKNTTGINGFIAWLCNCCKRGPATALPRQESETGRPKQEQPPIPFVSDFNKFSGLPPRSEAFSVKAPQATPDTQGITGVQTTDETNLGASSSDRRKSTPAPVLLDILKSPESDEKHENSGDVVPSEARAPERASTKTPDAERSFVEYPQAEAASAAPGNETSVVAESRTPPPAEERATEEPPLQPGNNSNLVAETATAASSSARKSVAAAAPEFQQQSPDSVSV